MASPHGFFNAPPAYMGFVGFVRLVKTGGVVGNADGVDGTDHGDYLIRATTADIPLFMRFLLVKLIPYLKFCINMLLLVKIVEL